MTTRRRGFTLLEIVTAMMIFFLVISFAIWTTAAAEDQAIAAQRARQLRMLGELKLGEIAVFEQHFDQETGNDQQFDSLPDDLREEFKDWRWRLQIKDVTAFGPQTDQNAEYLFEEPEDAKKNADGTPAEPDPSAGQPGAAKKGDTQLLRQLTLTVTAPGEDGGDGDAIEIVTFLPMIVQKTATKTPPAEPPK
jgi:prepilin-type N-terminal cleavage/methylation domain-containing protein